MLTPGGSGVPTESSEPSRSILRMRISTGSMPSASASGSFGFQRQRPPAARQSRGKPHRGYCWCRRVRIHLNVGDLIRPGAHQGGIAQHLGGGVSIGAAIGITSTSAASNLPSAGGAPARAQQVGVALVVADDRLFAAPDDLDRAV
jgi:hypothetical protein